MHWLQAVACGMLIVNCDIAHALHADGSDWIECCRQLGNLGNNWHVQLILCTLYGWMQMVLIG